MLQADASARLNRQRYKERNERLEKANHALKDAAALEAKVNADQVSNLQTKCAGQVSNLQRQIAGFKSQNEASPPQIQEQRVRPTPPPPLSGRRERMVFVPRLLLRQR